MCHWTYVTHTCGCQKKSEFVQCEERKADHSNTRCAKPGKVYDRTSSNYCYGHLVKPDAPKKYYSDVDE